MAKPKIVVTNNQDLSDAQKQRLESLGDVTFYDDLPLDGAEYMRRIKGADIICSGAAGLKHAYPEVRDVYITVSFVSVAFVDLDVLRANKVVLSNAPGANRHAVSEWIMTMATLLQRNFLDAINREEMYRETSGFPPITPGLAGKNMTVLGAGMIGTRVAELTACYGMQVKLFRRGDDLHTAVHDADVVVDALSANSSSAGLLNASFFAAMKQGSSFVSVSRAEVRDQDALLAALDSGHLRGAALDCGSITVGDTKDPEYIRYREHPKVIVTPHIAYNGYMTTVTGGDIMIDNVAAWIAGKPQNVVT